MIEITFTVCSLIFPNLCINEVVVAAGQMQNCGQIASVIIQENPELRDTVSFTCRPYVGDIEV